MINRKTIATLLLASGLALSACAKKAPQVLPPEPAVSTSSDAAKATGPAAPTPGSARTSATSRSPRSRA